jgi:hypothetical protein
MGFLLCDSFTLTFVLSRSSKLGIFSWPIIHYDQFCRHEHAWVYVRRASPFFISIMHACLKKKNLSCVYAQRPYDQFVNAQCPGLWPASITLFPYLLCIPIQKKKHVLYLCLLVFFSLPKKILMPRPARFHLWFFSVAFFGQNNECDFNIGYANSTLSHAYKNDSWFGDPSLRSSLDVSENSSLSSRIPKRPLAHFIDLQHDTRYISSEKNVLISSRLFNAPSHRVGTSCSNFQEPDNPPFFFGKKVDSF